MIIIPEQFAINLNDADYVNKCLNDYWDSYSDMTIPAVEARLLGLKTEYQYAIEKRPETKWYYGTGDVKNETSKYRSYLRLGIGYNLPLYKFTSKILGFEIFSKEAYILKIKKMIGKNLTKDHIFGVTDVGIETFSNYICCDWDLDYMVNEYIPNNLYQHFECRMLKSEHQKQDEYDTNGVARGKHTIEEKISMKHYEDVVDLPLVINRIEK
tara:strand:+ start:1180 stop:1815 length:636 start_codon:yes stop_codon:yes gene_type:complete